MDMIKIGKFIQECRKNKNLTQAQLANMLHVTDRAVSKWECGRSIPDSSIMLELSEILGVGVNELLLGEKIAIEQYTKQADETALKLIKEKEEADKSLLKVEILLGLTGTLFFLALIFISIFWYTYGNLPLWVAILLSVLGLIIFFICCFAALSIEQKAGYYECGVCHYRYVPTFKQVNFAPHLGRTRYMKCPKCGKKSWNKKVISKE